MLESGPRFSARRESSISRVVVRQPLFFIVPIDFTCYNWSVGTSSHQFWVGGFLRYRHFYLPPVLDQQGSPRVIERRPWYPLFVHGNTLRVVGSEMWLKIVVDRYSSRVLCDNPKYGVWQGGEWSVFGYFLLYTTSIRTTNITTTTPKHYKSITVSNVHSSV